MTFNSENEGLKSVETNKICSKEKEATKDDTIYFLSGIGKGLKPIPNYLSHT